MRINNFLLLAVTATVQLSSLPFTSATKKCKNGNDNYGCGAGYQEDGYFNIPPGDYSNCKCCCRQEDAGGFHENTCDGIKSNAKGCGSCMGERACYEASNAKIGDNSCVNGKSCYGLKDSSIKEYSCRSDQACKEMERTSVGSNSCGIGSDNAEACYRLWDSTVGDNSCKKKRSCSADLPENSTPTFKRRLREEPTRLRDKPTVKGRLLDEATVNRRLAVDYDNYGKNVTIGNNACNMESVCRGCENDSIVPDNSCNGDELDINDSTCNHCRVSCEHSSLELPLSFFTHSDPNPLLCTCTLLKNSPHFTALH